MSSATPATTAYLSLQHAHSLFQTTPDKLSAEQRAEVELAVARQMRIEEVIVASAEAREVVVPPSRLAAALAEISARYASETELARDLAMQGLTLATLREELGRSLLVESVLEKVVARAPAVTRRDAEIFYHLHLDRFRLPERRTLRHILITIDDTRRGGDRATVERRMQALHSHCLREPGKFADLAMRHSECPTALNGGELGTLARGTLFPSLDEIAFGLRKGELSAIVESPMGLHILRCDAIEAAATKPFGEVMERIQNLMLETRLRNHRLVWIKSLKRTSPAEKVRLSA